MQQVLNPTTATTTTTTEPTSTTAEGMELEGWKPSSTLAAYASTWAEATAWARGQGLVAEARKWARVGATASGVVKDSVEVRCYGVWLGWVEWWSHCCHFKLMARLIDRNQELTTYPSFTA